MSTSYKTESPDTNGDRVFKSSTHSWKLLKSILKMKICHSYPNQHILDKSIYKEKENIIGRQWTWILFKTEKGKKQMKSLFTRIV